MLTPRIEREELAESGANQATGNRGWKPEGYRSINDKFLIRKH